MNPAEKDLASGAIPTRKGVAMPVSWTPRTVSLLSLGACLLYAVLRYHVAKGVDWMHFPLWTTNKAFAWAGIGLICSSYWVSRFPLPKQWPCWLGMIGFGLSAMHTLSSLLLFSPANYRKFYDEASLSLNWTGEISMICGVISLACFTCASVSSIAGVRDWLSTEEWRKWQRVGAIGLYLTLIHVLVMGIQSLDPTDMDAWFNPQAWPKLAGIPLPSITLLSTLMIVATLAFRWFRRR